jgi:purine-binding chemotaxis protein CheW
MSPEATLCTVVLNKQRFGIPVDRVLEVLRAQAITPVPGAPETVRGLLNLRGQIVSAVDLRRCLRLPDLPPEKESFNVVVSAAGAPVSLLVDEVGDVVHVSADDYQPAPALLEDRIRRFVPGAYTIDGELLLALDVDAVVTVSTSSPLQA